MRALGVGRAGTAVGQAEPFRQRPHPTSLREATFSRRAGRRKSLARDQGGVEIARLVLEDITEAYATGSFSDRQDKLCRFALGQINGI